ncbi:hypothetical protein TEA_002610 [Camellia sinensis var. sinensis]|uniref:Uncharacterized protein n=1 Tax=Camellia sinensis var. sinensis TaxID=542762 RepID=A0A4S4E532_CAMSN|nr:hypothetical protein TEA_002610 [Camellia sinensis var. sinensis]
MSGHMTLLEAWIYEHFHPFRPHQNMEYTIQLPHVHRWTPRQEVGLTVSHLQMLREALDKLTFDEVTWDPYQYCRQHHPCHEITFYSGCLKCLDVVEPYHPKRVLRQFGRVQTIPPAPLDLVRTVRDVIAGFPLSRSSLSKPSPLRIPDFQGFLNDLQDWEMSLNDKDKKLKSRGLVKEKLETRVVDEDRKLVAKAAISDNSSNARQYDYSRNYDSITHLSGDFMKEESSPDATSEKELGNEYFKQKKFKEAVDCYSRSIALSPTAVAYANRAMAYLKMRRFQEAEDDCTEALNLDDRYIKAYSRRSTARKELGKLKESIEDAEFALRLEPHNQEIKKQYAETKSLYEKVKTSPLPDEILNKASGALRSSMQKVGKSKVEVNKHVGAVQSVSRSSQKIVTAAIQEDHNKAKKKEQDLPFYEKLIPMFNDSDGQVPAKTSMSVEEIENKSMRSKGQEANASCEDGVQSSGLESSKKNHKKQELKASVQELAARAASLAKAEVAKNITPPNSAYQFEVSWRGLAGDRTLQARLLKVTSPVALPQIFKNAMSAPMLVDIISEEMDLAVKYLENLAKVSRFDTIMMCLSSTDRAGYGMMYFATMQLQWSMRRGLIICAPATAPNNDVIGYGILRCSDGGVTLYSLTLSLLKLLKTSRKLSVTAASTTTSTTAPFQSLSHSHTAPHAAIVAIGTRDALEQKSVGRYS